MNSLLPPRSPNRPRTPSLLAEARDEAIVQQVRGNEAAWNNSTSEQKAALMAEALLPVSRDAGRFLYAVARSISAKRIVEFGTSFGVSTIYFAAAMKDNGGGIVIGSELEPSKVAKANQHLAEAGLSQFAEIRAGDAIQTLSDVGREDRPAVSRRLETHVSRRAETRHAATSPRGRCPGRRRDSFPRGRGELLGFRPQSCQWVRDRHAAPW